MLIKAGTYTFVETPAELESGQYLEQSINVTTSETIEGTDISCCVSKIAITKIDYFAIFFTYYSFVIGGEEQLSEPTPYGVYSTNGSGWTFSRVHTITEDTEVADDWGTWYKANTDYNEVNGEGEEEQPETPTKKFTRLYIGETVYSSNGKRFRKLQDTEYVEEETDEVEDTYGVIGIWQVNEEFPSGISSQDFAIEGNFYVVNSNVPQFETVPLAEFEWRNNSLYLISDIELTHDTYNVYYMSFSGTPSIFTQWGESEFIGIAKTNVNAPTLRTFQITGGEDVEKEEFSTLLKSIATKIS